MLRGLGEAGACSLALMFRTRVAHLAAAQVIGRQGLTGLALAHGYETAFWWITGIFAGGAVVGGTLLRRGPLVQKGTQSPAPAVVPTAQPRAGPAPA